MLVHIWYRPFVHGYLASACKHHTGDWSESCPWGFIPPPTPTHRGHFASLENCSSSSVLYNIVLTRLWHDYSPASAADGKALFQTGLHGIIWMERPWEDKTGQTWGGENWELHVSVVSMRYKVTQLARAVNTRSTYTSFGGYFVCFTEICVILP